MTSKAIHCALMAAVLWCALPQAVIADENTNANRLVVDTIRLLTAADEEQDALKRVKLLSSAKQNLERIIDDYPGSNAAVKLVTGQAIGNLSFEYVSAKLAVANAPFLIDLAMEQMRAENFDEVLSTLVTAIESIQYIRDTKTRAKLLVKVTLMQAYAGDIGGAKETAQSINDAFRRTQALQNIAGAQIYVANLEGALITLGEAVETAQSIRRPSSRVILLIRIAETQDEAKNIDDAVYTFGTAIETVKSMPGYLRKNSLETLRESALAKFYPNL